jgi:hypothetical protein
LIRDAPARALAAIHVSPIIVLVLDVAMADPVLWTGFHPSGLPPTRAIELVARAGDHVVLRLKGVQFQVPLRWERTLFTCRSPLLPASMGCIQNMRMHVPVARDSIALASSQRWSVRQRGFPLVWSTDGLVDLCKAPLPEGVPPDWETLSREAKDDVLRERRADEDRAQLSAEVQRLFASAMSEFPQLGELRGAHALGGWGGEALWMSLDAAPVDRDAFWGTPTGASFVGCIEADCINVFTAPKGQAPRPMIERF